ncbi:MAG: 4-alpha-glucanotransferase [Clostridia bacterium]|nr:4-alpha-glucanotransferase [Clostridia bacterium]
MRASGILLPVFSLPSPYGIGGFGAAAYAFIDFLARAKQRYWQMLPMGPTGYGDSPYQSFSTFAGNPYFIDLTALRDEGLLTDEELNAEPIPGDARRVEYGTLFTHRLALLKKAGRRFLETPAYRDFLSANADWLDDYALFMAIKEENGHRSWQEWPVPLKTRAAGALKEARARLRDVIYFHRFVQYAFYAQFGRLKAYAAQKGIQLIGDIPIYVAMDSADTWTRPDLFRLDASLTPEFVAGCPPDYFSSTGQLWGNPVYRWPAHEQEGYAWWIRRVRAAFTLYDAVRIDHFRGFASYYEIPYGHDTAEFGTWRPGPGMSLFTAVKQSLGDLPIIAEDLGLLTPDVTQLLRDTRLPGMKVLQFAFDGGADNSHLPHRFIPNCVVYTGTHDNATSREWYARAAKDVKIHAKRYLAFSGREGCAVGLIRGIWSSVADTAIAPLQDFLGLGAESRMNTPSTLGKNWMWRALASDFTDELIKGIADITELYERDGR